MAKRTADAQAALVVDMVAISRLQPARYNPRTISDDALSRLERGITEFGLVEPLVARQEDGLLIGGHQRLAVAVRLGWTHVPVVWLSGVSDQRAAALNILLNNPHAQGEWDMPKLAEVLSGLDAEGFDATLAGFDAEELENLLTWVSADSTMPEVEGDADAPFKVGDIVRVRVRNMEATADVREAVGKFLTQHPEWQADVEED